MNAPVKPPANALPEWRLDDLYAGRDDPRIELDLASATYADAPSDGSANLSGPPGGERILRGGSWSHNPAICRSAYRDFIAPDNPGWQGRIGLRVVCAL